MVQLQTLQKIAKNTGVATTIHAKYLSYDATNDLVNSADLIFSGSLLNVTQVIYDLNAPEAYEENTGKITLS